MIQRDPAIVVIGATGYTGGLIAHELALVGAPAVLAARDPARLAAVAEATGVPVTQTVDVKDPASLRRLIRAGDAVINTAGPFTELGEPVIQACIAAGAHYFDTAGEQPFIHAMHERYHGAARAGGVAVVNAMAFEYALGDCATAVAARGLDVIRSLDVVYAWAGAVSSIGTRRTVLRMLGRRAWARRDGVYHREPPGSRHRTVRLTSGRTLHAVGFGAGEVVTAPRHLSVADARCWIVLDARTARLVPAVAPALPLVLPVLRPLVAPLVARRPDPTAAERESSRFTIRIELDAGAPRAVELQGADPYGLAAAAAVYGARRAMEPDHSAGVLAPAELVDPEAFLAYLAPRGLRLVRDHEVG